ncbi:MAG TPA: Ig-like domain-containing protein [Chthoniobacterales bacterium]|nr:Ig-like domain-containing protein [Chthoniobacterales bacterium]
MPHNYYNSPWLPCRLASALLFLVSISLAEATNLRFGWNASADPNVAGYNLFYGTASGSYTKTVNAGSATSTNVSLKPGATYYFVVTAYNSFGFQSAPSNEVALTIDNRPPSVSLTSPQANSTFTANASIGLSAAASDPDGAITKVEFYRDTNKIGESASAPYSTTWSNAPSGSFTLTALAFDDSGAAVRSTGIPITISGTSPASTPTPNAGNKVNVLALTPIVKGGGVARFKLITTQASPTNTVVNYSLGGNATSGVNYSMKGMTGQVTIPSGKRSALMAMHTLNGPGNRKVTVSVAPGNGYTPGRGNAVVRIIGR